MINYQEITQKEFSIEPRLRKLLNESMCVADNISSIVDDVVETFWKVIPNLNRKPYKDYGNVSYAQIKIDINLTDKDILPIYTTFLFFNSNQELDDFLKHQRINKPTYNEEKHAVYIVVCVISGWFDEQQISGTLQHEMLHAYNKTKSNSSYTQKQMPDVRKKGRLKHLNKDHRLYRIACAHLNDVEIVSKSVSIAIYLLTGGEVTAYVNGLYKRLYIGFIKNMSDEYDETLHNDTLYKFYILLDNFCRALDNGKEYNFENIRKIYNISESHAIKICENALKQIERGISYAVQKAKLDYDNEIFRNNKNKE